MARKEEETTSSELDTFRNHLKAIPTESILLSGKRFKEYQITPTTFVKSKMWQDKYETELKGIELASANGIAVPEVISHSLGEWGSITYRLIKTPRLDQTIWNDYSGDTLANVGSTLARIHQIKVDGEPSTVVFPRRNKYFLDDMRRRAIIPEDYFAIAETAFAKACSLIYQSGQPGFVHGDFDLQNIFGTEPLTVFDWEYSHSGYPIFDLGTCLSDMVFAVTEGNWDLKNYSEGCRKVVEGYSSGSSAIQLDDNILTALRFLGHRVPPQFYLFAIEKLAINDGIDEVKEILNGNTSPDESREMLKAHGIELDDLWGEKILKALSRGGYQSNPDFWEWTKKAL